MMLAIMILVLLPIIVTEFYVIEKVKDQHMVEDDLKINNTLQGIVNELNQLKDDYGNKVTAFGSSEKVALPTYILHKYGDYRYLDASNKENLVNSIVESTLLFNLALNFDVVEVRRLNKELIVALENQRRIGENLIPGSVKEDITNEEKVDFVSHGDRFLLRAQAPIIWKGNEVGIIIIKKYINQNYLNDLKTAQGVNIAIISNRKVLVSTLSHSLLPPEIYSLDTEPESILRNIDIQGEAYNFSYKTIEMNDEEKANILVGLSTRPSIDRINRIKSDLLLMNIYLVLFIMILTFIFVRRTTHPLRKMLGTTADLKEGNFDAKLVVNTRDELAEISENINSLGEMLASYEEELSQNKEFEESVHESIREGMIIIDNQGIVQSINTAMANLLKTSKEEYRNKFFFKLPPFKDLAEGFWELLQEEGSIVRNEFKYRDEVLSLKIYPLKSRDEDLDGAVIIAENITKKLNLEKQLLLNDKLASIGRFTAGIAHEINNPLSSITNFVETMLCDEKEETRREYLDCILSETKRISTIVQGLLNFSRQSKSEFGLVDLREVLELSLKICQYRKGYDKFEVVRDYEESPYYVTGNFNQLEQVFINLILNAFESMKDGGSLTISIRTRQDNGMTEVSFKDTGKGIEPQYLQNIFDPFFTTKEERQGVGLGLSISYGIIKNHGGDIKVDSEVGKGSTFIVSLPGYRS
jgi:PAS domain S-box-containing protein